MRLSLSVSVLLFGLLILLRPISAPSLVQKEKKNQTVNFLLKAAR